MVSPVLSFRPLPSFGSSFPFPGAGAGATGVTAASSPDPLEPLELTPAMRELLAMRLPALPAMFGATGSGAGNPFAALSALDPPTALALVRGALGRPDQPDFPAPAVNENIRQTFGPGALPMSLRSERAFDLSELALLAALAGASVEDIQALLGRGRPGSRRLARAIKTLARRLQEQPPSPKKIARALRRVHAAMLPYVARNPAEQRIGERLFRDYYGIAPGGAEPSPFVGQGPLGNAVAAAAPSAVAEAPAGQFRVSSPSQAGDGALRAAISQIGVREATGNNDGVPSQRYMDGRREPWCANFVSWCFRQAGHPLPGNQRALASCDAMASGFKGRGKFMARGQGTPKPGDVIFFGRPGDYTHVGIVEKVENGRVHTVEGNTSNQVARRSYALNSSYIQGYGVT